MSCNQATALFTGREVRIVGTANIGEKGEGFTTLRSVPGSEYLSPLTVGYYQVGSSSRKESRKIFESRIFTTNPWLG